MQDPLFGQVLRKWRNRLPLRPLVRRARSRRRRVQLPPPHPLAQAFVAPTPQRSRRRTDDQSSLRSGFFTDDRCTAWLRWLRRGLRGCALLLGLAFRRSKLVVVDVADIEETKTGLLVAIGGTFTCRGRKFRQDVCDPRRSLTRATALEARDGPAALLPRQRLKLARGAKDEEHAMSRPHCDPPSRAGPRPHIGRLRPRRRPSPVVLTMRPWCSAIFGSISSRRCVLITTRPRRHPSVGIADNVGGNDDGELPGHAIPLQV